MYKTEDFRQLLTEKLNIFEKLSVFTDIRKNPQIKLHHILMLIILMYFYSIKSFLELDRLTRKKHIKKLFGCRRKMVASDSTIIRALNWLKGNEVARFARSFFQCFKNENLHRRRLRPKGPNRSIGIIDGSCMSNHYLSAFVLYGKAEYPLVIENCNKRGKELPVSKVLLKKAKAFLNADFPDLVLFDALYFNIGTFKLIRDKYKSHLLIKCKEPDFREVLKEAKLTFAAGDFFKEEIEYRQGFDSERFCHWQIKVTTGEFAGYPVKIAYLIEDYPKRKDNAHIESWIITTDMDLSSEEIREAAHARWHIENDIFKKLSHHNGTKKFHFKQQGPFFNYIQLLGTALAITNILVYILARNEKAFKSLLDGIKPTEKNILSQIEELFDEGVFSTALI